MALQEQINAVRQHIDRGDYAEAARLCLAVLKQDPRNVSANLEYGHLAIKMQRADEAIIIFRKLLAIAPNHTVAHDRLAFLYRLSGDYPNAEKHASAALGNDPQLVNSRLALASVRIAQGERAAALQIFNELRQELPGEVHIEKAYAEALLRLGDFDSARREVRELVQRKPSDAFLYALLSRTHRFEAGSEETALLRSLVDGDGELRRDLSDNEARIQACMALSKVESDLDNHPLAFSYLQRAKQLRKQETPYDPQTTVQQHKLIRQVFSRQFFAADHAGCQEAAPVFIVGMPRSGTTLLERIVCSHPQVSPGGELHTVGQLVQELCAHAGRNQYDYPALGRLPARVWTQAGEEYLRRARTLVGESTRFTDKMPANYLWLGCIHAMLPRARIIHLTRHPVDNCLSIYQQDFATAHPWANDLRWLGEYYTSYRQLMAHWRAVMGDSLIEVSYEDLVTDTGAACAALGRRLGIAISLEGIAGSQQQGEILTASQWQARQPIHSASVSRWEALREELQPLLAALGEKL